MSKPVSPWQNSTPRKPTAPSRQARSRPRQDSDYELPAPGVLALRQAVDLEVIDETELGYKALIDGRWLGLIYREEISQALRTGERLRGWIKALRPDGKIDLSITLLDAEGRDDLDEQILRHLASKGGVALLSDRSPPEEIFRLFRTSKKNFKRAIGRLYKARRIVIEDTRIRAL